MIKFKMKKWIEKMSRPANLQIVTFPFVPPCNGLLIVQLRAKVQGRTYEIFNNAMPTIVDGYGVAGAYVSTVLFVEKGKQVSVSSNSNIDSTAHYFVPLVGGVLRNLSIFKAFRHFMSLQKGGGVDGQTGCKKGVTENSSDAQCSAYSGAHYASRVRNDSRMQWSQPIRFGRCARWLFSACSCCFMEYWSDRYALPLRCVHHFDKRSAVSVQRRKRNKESRYCSPVNALHKEYIALSERRCAA